MKKVCRTLVAALALGLTVAVVHADVKTQQKSHVKFEGMLGRMMGMFGGMAAREGVVMTVAVQGNRKATLADTMGQIIDLGEQKVYDLDIRKKEYKVTTFAEMRRRMEEMQKKMQEQAAKGGEPGAAPAKGEKEMEIDFSLKESGQRKSIAGHDTHEVVMTITVREKGKKLEESGGMVLTANSWMAPRIAAMKEIADFDMKYMKAIGLDLTAAGLEGMAAALAMYPGLKDAMGRFEKENVNMDGTPILTTMTVETVASPQQQTTQAETKEQRPSGIGGLMGGLGKRLAKKKDEPETGRKLLMTMTHEIVSVSTSVTPTDVAIPAGFKEDK